MLGIVAVETPGFGAVCVPGDARYGSGVPCGGWNGSVDGSSGRPAEGMRGWGGREGGGRNWVRACVSLLVEAEAGRWVGWGLLVSMGLLRWRGGMVVGLRRRREDRLELVYDEC